MASKKPLFVSAGGFLGAHNDAIITELSRRGVSDDVQYELFKAKSMTLVQRVVDVYAEEAGVIGGCPRNLGEMIARWKRFDNDYVNSEITAVRYPVYPEQFTTEGVDLVTFDHLDHDPTDAEIDAEFGKRGLQDANLGNTLAFGFENPDEQRRGVIMQRGSSWLYADGYRFFPYLYGVGGRRFLRQSWRRPEGRWDRGYRFLGVRK